MSSECQQLRELMDSYLSGELSVETNHVVLRHLDACQTCRSELQRRQRLRSLLARAVDTDVDTDRATQRITQAIDREERSWARTARWSGIAAAVVVGVGVATLLLLRPVDTAAYEDSVQNHVACALAMPEMTYDSERVARSLVPPFERIAETIGLTHGIHRVVDAHMCPFKGREYVHVVMQGGGQTLSLFVEPAVHGALPTTPERRALDAGTLEMFSTSRQGYRVSATATQSHRVFVIADQLSDRSDETTSEILQSAARFIQTLER